MVCGGKKGARPIPATIGQLKFVMGLRPHRDLRYVRATGLFIIVAVFTPLLRQRLRAGSNTGDIRVLIAGLQFCIGFVLLGLESAGSLSFLFLLPLFLLLTFLEGTP